MMKNLFYYKGRKSGFFLFVCETKATRNIFGKFFSLVSEAVLIPKLLWLFPIIFFHPLVNNVEIWWLWCSQPPFSQNSVRSSVWEQNFSEKKEASSDGLSGVTKNDFDGLGTAVGVCYPILGMSSHLGNVIPSWECHPVLGMLSHSWEKSCGET